MINPKLIMFKADLEREVVKAKQYLITKEMEEYSNWLKTAEPSEKRAARDKVLDILKADDEEWRKTERYLAEDEVELGILNNIILILQNTLRAMSNSDSGISLDMFKEIEDRYILIIED